MEKLGEIEERETAKKTNKSRSSSMEYFKEKHDKQVDLKREEMELKKREMAMKEKEAERAWEIKEQEIKGKRWKQRNKMRSYVPEMKVIQFKHYNNSYNSNKACLCKCSSKIRGYWNC
ncbi:Hypothetical predicted protein [Paramuricea clavata]|uniref:Uncharacterized protein n=1 Tax=Paramuricea clavata TaxID=317549 RepID=A0A7D9I9J3_PARCT|nr:Hypothetical predicted protein [Paramuricea clavata]